MLTIIKNPTTCKLYALSTELDPPQMYDFDGSPILAPADATTWPVVAKNVPSLYAWLDEPGNYRTLYGVVSVFTIEKDGHKVTFNMGDNITYIRNWLNDAVVSPSYEAVSWVWLGAYSDRNVARSLTG